MKRTLLFATILLALASFGLRADEVNNGNGHIDVVEGSLAILNEKVPARLVFDFSQTHAVEFGKKDAVDKDCGPLLEYLASKGEDHLADWGSMKDDLQAHCEKRFNKRNKMYIDNGNAQYEVKIVWMKGKGTNSYNYSEAHAVCFTFGNIFLDKFLFRYANKAK